MWFNWHLFEQHAVRSRFKKGVTIDTVLRMVRYSYAIINTLMVLLVMKPFQAPIKKIKQRLLTYLQNQRE